MTEYKYEMTISLNVLNHLGLNLYSNVPAVLSEVVANSYDADATRVDVTVDVETGTVTIQDNGHGMTRSQVNMRFLNVGYERRKDESTRTSPQGRAVMGRKGIGKLSLFSIANEVEVYTIRDGEKSALLMSVPDIRQKLDATPSDPYHPVPLDDSLVDFDAGTRIVLRKLKKGLGQAGSGLRTRLARRFSVLGAEQGFQLFIGGLEVTAQDRDYFHKLQYVWAYDDQEERQRIFLRASGAEEKYGLESVTLLPVREDGSLDTETGAFRVSGWIGTAASVSALKDSNTKDNLNKISLIMRGKLAHEDLLEEFNENGVYASYLIGEVRADFLDDDEQVDIATSSRQRIVEDDPRYQALLVWLRGEISRIGKDWLGLRNAAGSRTALDNPLIAEWFATLRGDTKKKAERLFGKINQLTIDDPKERNELFSQVVLGFETLRYRDNLDALDYLDVEDLPKLARLFGDISDIQATMYHQIVQQRLEVIDKLREHVDGNDLEKVLQHHLYDNLWLLDPAWERATDHSMEERVGLAFAAIDSKLKADEREARMDIRYKRTGGIHVIVELKRASVKLDDNLLTTQVDKYRRALKKYLMSIGSVDAIETVCVVGHPLINWEDSESKTESLRSLAAKNIRVVQYEKLLQDAQASYREYLDAQVELGRVQTLVLALAAQIDAPESTS